MTMADAQVDSLTDGTLHLHSPYKIRKSQFRIVNHNRGPRGTKQRKRKRLNQVVDKLSTHVSTAELALIKNNFHHYNNNNNNSSNNNNNKFIKVEYAEDFENEFRALKASKHMLSSVSQPNDSTDEAREMAPLVGQMFRFDHADRERIMRCGTSSVEEEIEDVFSQSSSSNKSPHSSNTDSPKINLSPLQIKEQEEVCSSRRPHQRGRGAKALTGCACVQCSFKFGRSHPLFHPISPVTPMSPLPGGPPVYSFEHYLHHKYLPGIFRRRSRSDSDLPLWFETTKTEREVSAFDNHSRPYGRRPISEPHVLPLVHHKAKSHYVKMEQGSPQDGPLDLSTKGGAASDYLNRISPSHPLETLLNLPQLNIVPPQFLPPKGTFSVPVVKGDVASPTTKKSVAVRYKLDVSPVVEEMPPGSDVAYVCPVCGQMFSLHDRLAKHMASRHKSRTQSGDSTCKAYLCEVCNRSFARSDMLTRHMRLHTGVKPYTCKVCGQVFSRSDHLSTHQRTHTGEKPYKCPQCPYAACRRDMITRHMRTHARYDSSSAAFEHPEESSVPDSPHLSSSLVQSSQRAASLPFDVTRVKRESNPDG